MFCDYSSSNKARKPKIVFKWHGIGNPNGGCDTPLGFCIIRGASDTDSGLIPVSAGIVNEKLILVFPSDIESNFGLTTDGYLLVSEDIEIPEDVIQLLEINNLNTNLKSGIYSAYFSTEENRYIGVAIDLN